MHDLMQGLAYLLKYNYLSIYLVCIGAVDVLVGMHLLVSLQCMSLRQYLEMNMPDREFIARSYISM